jgi:phosphoglycolate phosphatase
VKLALFDCDGTLVDSQHSIIAAMNAGFASSGLVPPDERSVRRVVGLSLVEAVARLLPDEDAGRHESIAEAYKRAFHSNRTAGAHPEPLYPGLRQALDALESAGWLLGVATGKSRRGLLATLNHHGLAARFMTLQTADEPPGKPHPAMLLRAIAEAGSSRDRTVMIGDTSFDMQMARNAGVRGIGVSWGYHEPEELRATGAAVVVDCYDDLPGAVQRIMGGDLPEVTA